MVDVTEKVVEPADGQVIEGSSNNGGDMRNLSRGRKRTRTFFNSIKRKISGKLWVEIMDGYICYLVTRSLSSTNNQEGRSIMPWEYLNGQNYYISGLGNMRSVSENRQNLTRTGKKRFIATQICCDANNEVFRTNT